MVSPVIIMTLLHCYAYPTLPNNYEIPAVNGAITWLIVNELITPRLDRNDTIEYFDITEKGEVWVQVLCSTPLPKLAYVDPTK